MKIIIIIIIIIININITSTGVDLLTFNTKGYRSRSKPQNERRLQTENHVTSSPLVCIIIAYCASSICICGSSLRDSQRFRSVAAIEIYLAASGFRCGVLYNNFNAFYVLNKSVSK